MDTGNLSTLVQLPLLPCYHVCNPAQRLFLKETQMALADKILPVLLIMLRCTADKRFPVLTGLPDSREFVV